MDSDYNMDFDMALGPTLAQSNSSFPAYSQSHPSSDIQDSVLRASETEVNAVTFDKGPSHAMPPDHSTNQSSFIYARSNPPPLSLDRPTHTSPPVGDERTNLHAPNTLSPYNSPQTLHQQPQMTTKKRAPKAPTMTAKRWKPCEARIKELYVRQGKSLKELREIINKEFGLAAKLVIPYLHLFERVVAEQDVPQQSYIKL